MIALEEARNLALTVWQQQQPPPEVWSVVSGVAAFSTTLAVSTWCQQRILRMSTGTLAPFPSLVGFATVCVASVVSHRVSLSTLQVVRSGDTTPWRFWEQSFQRGNSFGNNSNSNPHASFSYADKHLELPVGRVSWHTLRICCIGVVAFKVLLGGRFWAIAPSSYTHLGSFARTSSWMNGSIPATARYASSAERLWVERMGRRIGCHTCGSRMAHSRAAVKFVGDHMPPKAVANQQNARWIRRLLGNPVQFRFFPQCVPCSSKQGTILGKATSDLRAAIASPASLFTRRSSKLPNLARAGGGVQAYNHGLRPRLHHLAGGVVGGVAVLGANEADLMDENRYRYAQWQHDLHEALLQETPQQWLEGFRRGLMAVRQKVWPNDDSSC
jgi:hypothetical protein